MNTKTIVLNVELKDDDESINYMKSFDDEAKNLGESNDTFTNQSSDSF